jgi:hypothetical protein
MGGVMPSWRRRYAKYRSFVAILIVGVVLSGCAAMGVVETGDPDKKIRDAYILFGEQQRPLPAERLIREAIAIYQHKSRDTKTGTDLFSRKTGTDLFSRRIRQRAQGDSWSEDRAAPTGAAGQGERRTPDEQKPGQE